jgi:hypothetical protein
MSQHTNNGKEEFVPGIYQCRKCKDIIWSRYRGMYCSCRCGASAVDDAGLYSRFMGYVEDYCGEITLEMLRTSDTAIRSVKRILNMKEGLWSRR